MKYIRAVTDKEKIIATGIPTVSVLSKKNVAKNAKTQKSTNIDLFSGL
jgi:hypothetical protein